MSQASSDIRRTWFALIRWIMHATGAKGEFEIGGIDRIRTRNGQLSENVVVFDTAAFEARSGLAVPWAPRHRVRLRSWA